MATAAISMKQVGEALPVFVGGAACLCSALQGLTSTTSSTPGYCCFSATTCCSRGVYLIFSGLEACCSCCLSLSTSFLCALSCR